MTAGGGRRTFGPSAPSPNAVNAVLRTALSVTVVAAAAFAWSSVGAQPAPVRPAPAAAVRASTPTPATPVRTVHDLRVNGIDGKPVDLSSYKGKALLIVNTASECGYTPQYATLQKLYEKYAARGFEVLAFPCNDFGGQEPGTAQQIQTFCSTKYHITFPLFEKVRAKAPKSPLYEYLTERTGEGLRGEIKWNFTKFLVNPAGDVVARFEPSVDPLDAKVTGALEKLLTR